MWEKVFEAALSTNGIFAVFFVALLCYVLKDSRNREKRMEVNNKEREGKYQQTIDKLADKFDIVREMKHDIEDLKEEVKEIKR